MGKIPSAETVKRHQEITPEHGSNEEDDDPQIDHKDEDDEIMEEERKRKEVLQMMTMHKKIKNCDQSNESTPRTAKARVKEDRRIIQMRHGNKGSRNYDETMKELHKEGKERGAAGKQLRDMIKSAEKAAKKEANDRNYFEEEINARWMENMKTIYTDTMTQLQDLRNATQSERTRRCIDEQTENFKEMIQMLDRETKDSQGQKEMKEPKHPETTEARETRYENPEETEGTKQMEARFEQEKVLDREHPKKEDDKEREAEKPTRQKPNLGLAIKREFIVYAGREWVMLSGVNNTTFMRDIRIRTAKALGVDAENVKLFTKGKLINDNLRIGDTVEIRVRMSANAEVKGEADNKIDESKHRESEAEDKTGEGKQGPNPASEPDEEGSNEEAGEVNETGEEPRDYTSDSSVTRDCEMTPREKDPEHEDMDKSPRSIVDISDEYLQSGTHGESHECNDMLMMFSTPEVDCEPMTYPYPEPRLGRADECPEGYRVKAVLGERTSGGIAQFLVEWEEMHPDSGGAVWVDARELDCPCGQRARLTHRRQTQTTGIPFTEDDARELAFTLPDQEEEGPLPPGEYEVYEVVDERRVGGESEYRVRWKKYGRDHDEWLTMDEMERARDSVWGYLRATRMGYPRHTVPPDIWSNDA